MSWTNKFRVIGKPIITEEKPGGQLEKVLAEIQNKAITKIEADNSASGSGNTESSVRITIQRTGNSVTIKAEADTGDILPDGTSQYQVLAWDGAKWIADFIRAT